jgi:Tetracyclin repressor-like, C-terminal domain
VTASGLAFVLLREAVAAALAAGGNRADRSPAASTLWACLHGVITLREDRPAFPSPPQAGLITGLIDQLLTGAGQTPSGS